MNAFHELTNESFCSASFLEGRLHGLLAANRIQGLPETFVTDYDVVDGGYGFLAFSTRSTITLPFEDQTSVLFIWDFHRTNGWDVVPSVHVFGSGKR